MTRDQFIASIQYFLTAENVIGCAVYFVVEEDGNQVIRFADIEDEAKNDLKNRFLDAIREKFVTADEFNYLDISTADERPNSVYRYDIDERPEKTNILNEILRAEEFPAFRFNQANLGQVRGFLITIGNDQNKMAIYKKHYPVNLFKRDRFMLRVHDQRLSKIESDVIAIDHNFDLMMIGETLIVLNVKTFERFFGFENIIRSRATQTIEAINAMLLMADIGQVHDMAADLSMARKLMRVRNSPVFAIPVANIIQFIQEHPELRGRLGINDTGDRIVLDTNVSKRLLLKLLNDDYLYSQLTALQYASHSKDAIANTPPVE